jgi:hypothetical protein
MSETLTLVIYMATDSFRPVPVARLLQTAAGRCISQSTFLRGLQANQRLGTLTR